MSTPADFLPVKDDEVDPTNGISETPFDNPRPKIELPGYNRLLSEFASDVGTQLAKHDIFSRNGSVFTVNPTGTGLEEMTGDALRTWVEQHIVCYKKTMDRSGATYCFRKTMSSDDANGILASPQLHARLRHIERCNAIRLPVMRTSGQIELLPTGYDPQAKVFTASGNDFDLEMPLERARQVIDDLLGEFCFADNGRSKSVVIASMQTLYGLGLLPAKALRPCFIYLANCEGAGKSLLAKCAIVPILGNAPTGCTPKEEAEMAKLLLTTIMEARPVLFLDNMKGHLASESLEGFLTASQWQGRILGASKSFTGENNTVVFVTGNQCTLSPDIRRRSLIVELFMREETSEERVFKRPLEVPEILEMRSNIMAALWSFVRHWDESGRSAVSRSHPSFPHWTPIIGGIVEAAGYGCPVEPAKVAAGGDTDLSDMKELVSKLMGEGPLHTREFSDIVETAREGGLFERIIGAEGTLDNKQRTAFGKLLGRYDGRLVGECRFSVMGKGHARRFRFERVSP